MTRNSLILCLAAVAALAACSKENHNIVAGPADGEETNVSANAGVQLPPSIAASKVYRCADNSVAYVDWLSDNKSANLRSEANGNPTNVVAAEPGKPMTGGGYSVTGSATSANITVVRPGHASTSCKG
jgi:hypothetical protein